MKPIQVFLQQRVIPVYRIPFLELLAAHEGINLTVFAGQPRPVESIKTGQIIKGAQFIQTRNIHILQDSFYFCYQRNLTAALQEIKPEVIILEGNVRYLSTRHAFGWARQFHAGLIGWGLGVPPKQGTINKLLNYSWKSFLSNFDAMIAYSQTGAEQYQSAGFSEQQVFTAVNATVPRPAQPPERPVTLTDGKATVLYVGRLQARKRLDVLIRTCAQLPPYLQPNLWIVGDGPMREELEKTAGLFYPNTRFFGGLYDRELAEIYSQADLFVLPGTGGLAAQQAMSYALPVIMAAGDGTQANLIKPENGWTIPADDDSALFNTLSEALSNPVKLREKGQAAFHTIQKEINIEAMVQEFLNAIQYTVESRKNQ
ncbi:MAG: hypothetical protein CL609_14330 [Anaerolineaceae bacterium]|nr:hypothetical protein [Anaerolineaceae bacterium]